MPTKHHALIISRTKTVRKLLLPIDEEIVKLLENTKNEDADKFGVLDFGEELCGLGFVSLQTYLNTVAHLLGIEKKELIDRGPEHKSGTYVTQT